MATAPRHVDELCFSTADDFLHALDPLGRRWRVDGVSPSPWIFRGQADARWPLAPRAWREGPEMQALERRFGPEVDRHCPPLPSRPWFARGERVEGLERRIVREWVRIANDVGLPIPLGEGDCNGGLPTEFDEPHLDSPVVAMAQHAGLPTRMLDFTSDPRVAAFFAAEDSAARGRSIVVWAFRRDRVMEGSPVRVHEFVRADNPLLAAQRGVLLAVEVGHLPVLLERYERLPTIDELAAGPCVRLTVPATECDGVLEQLEVARVTRAHLFPHYGAVADSIRAATERIERQTNARGGPPSRLADP